MIPVWWGERKIESSLFRVHLFCDPYFVKGYLIVLNNIKAMWLKILLNIGEKSRGH